MGYAEFEEKEFERPLYNQLEMGTPYVWSPGQCFEKFIGIDYSLYTIHDLSERFGLRNMPPGIILKDIDFTYMWKLMRRRRELPDFKLNMFIQAKRPFEHKNGMPKYGYNKRCFKFKISPEQQRVLEKLNSKLNRRALVVYAAPVFSTFRELYKYTADQTMIKNTTFPIVTDLEGHQSWLYDSINRGVACSEPEEKIVENIMGHISNFVNKNTMYAERNNDNGLLYLLKMIEETLQSMEDTDIHIAEYFNRKNEIYNRVSYNENRGRNLEYLIAYILVREFCDIYNLEWFVLGK